MLRTDSLSALKKSTGMSEKAVGIRQGALAGSHERFANRTPVLALEVNAREVPFLRYCPFNMQKGHKPKAAVDLAFLAYYAKLVNGIFTL